MITMRKYRYIKIVALTLSLALGAGIAHYYFSGNKECGPIYTFNAERDLEDMIDLYKKDWYWLSNRQFSRANIEFALKTNSPNEYEPRYFGKMKIKVLRENNKLVGFITYYMLNFYEGKVLFLAVNPEFRGKRYGAQLLQYAVEDLKKQGATVVSLVTRIDNISAQKLYTRFGFKETSRDLEDGFIHYAMDV